LSALQGYFSTLRPRPVNSTTPTGLTPSASTASWSVQPTVTTRSGGALISVVPYLCSMRTGAAPPAAASASPSESPPQADRPNADSRTAASARTSLLASDGPVLASDVGDIDSLSESWLRRARRNTRGGPASAILR